MLSEGNHPVATVNPSAVGSATVVSSAMAGQAGAGHAVAGQVVAICRDADLLGPVLASAAAVGATVEVAGTPTEVRRWWGQARLILVAADSAAMVAGLALPARSGVHVFGRAAEQVLTWSVPLEASALVLPDQISLLGPLLAADSGRGVGVVISVSGGSGGVGTSTLACGLAHVAASLGRRVGLVELDPFGGGLDVMCGADAEPGWRWPDLVSASGHVAELGGRLPTSFGVDIVANGREGPTPSEGAIHAVVSSLQRSHDVVVLDQPDGGWREGLGVIVAAAEAGAILAARARLRSWVAIPDVVAVRTGPGRRMAPEAVGHALGITASVEIRHDTARPRALEVGAPPGRGRGRFVADCRRLLGELLDARF